MRVVVLSVFPEVVRVHTDVARSLGHEVVAVVVPRVGRFTREHVEEGPSGLDVVFADTPRSLPRILGAFEPDVGLCCGFPWLISEDAIKVPRLGIVNGHPSLLPKHRGPIPMAWAVRAGDDEIGLTYHYMDASFDTGNVLAQVPIPLDEIESEETLEAKLDAASARLLPLVFDRLERGDAGEPQTGGGEYESWFGDDYARLDLTMTAAEAHRRVRAWGFVPARARVGPLLEREGRTIRVEQTSRTEVPGAERVDFADAPLWLVASRPL